MAAIFFGVIDFSASAPDVAGLTTPSPIHPAVGRPVTYGMLSPLAPSGICGINDWKTDVRAARSKIGAAMFAGRNPEKSVVLVAAVTAMGTPWEGGLRYMRR